MPFPNLPLAPTRTLTPFHCCIFIVFSFSMNLCKALDLYLPSQPLGSPMGWMRSSGQQLDQPSRPSSLSQCKSTQGFVMPTAMSIKVSPLCATRICTAPPSRRGLWSPACCTDAPPVLFDYCLSGPGA